MRKIAVYILCLALLVITGTQAYAGGDWDSPSGGFFADTPKYVFATFYEYGLQVFDVSDPMEPEGAGEKITRLKQALDVEVVGDYAYVADGHGGLQIYNISNLEEIELTTEFDRPANARAVAVEDDHAYICAYDSLQIFNVSDPVNAYWITTYEEDIRYDQAIDVVGDYAYVACGVDGLKVLDISEPADTFEVGHVRPPGMARDVAISGNYAYIAAGSAGLQIVDVSFPNDPVVVGCGVRIGELVDGVFIDGNIAYMADRSTGLHIIDISDPNVPSELGSLRVKGKASGVYVMGGYAFIAAISGDISIVDVNNPAEPTLVRWLRWKGTARSIVVAS